jgi:hypothetical protein
MRIDVIFEDATSDVSAFGAANDILHKLISYLMHADSTNYYGFQGKRFPDGETFLTLRGADIGLDEGDAALWFRFGVMDGYTPRGHISKFQRSGESVITVYCLDNGLDIDDAARIIIHRYIVHDILLHELTHYLDSKRYPRFHETGSNKDQGADYYNNAKEFNAYFTNLATPLLRFLAMPASDRLPRIAQNMGISTDFAATLAMLIERGTTQDANSRVVAGFLKHLNKRNHRALLKRLYGLHQQVIEKLQEQPVSIVPTTRNF